MDSCGMHVGISAMVFWCLVTYISNGAVGMVLEKFNLLQNRSATYETGTVMACGLCFHMVHPLVHVLVI